MSWKFDDFLAVGKNVEHIFSRNFENSIGGKCTPSEKKDDIYKHIDVYWNGKLDGKEYKNIGFDVKGLRKSKRSDLLPDDTIEWIELKNVQGYDGWIYGKADYIAFECLNDWIVISRKKLIEAQNNEKLELTRSHYALKTSEF